MGESWYEGYAYFLEGNAYIVSPKGSTVCCGKEEEVKSYFNGGEMPQYLLSHERLALINMKEIIDGDREANMERTGNDGTTGGEQKTTRQSTPRERLALRSSKSQRKNILR